MRKLSEFINGNRMTRVYRVEAGVYLVKLYNLDSGKWIYYEPADYETNDLGDAVATASHMAHKE